MVRVEVSHKKIESKYNKLRIRIQSVNEQCVEKEKVNHRIRSVRSQLIVQFRWVCQLTFLRSPPVTAHHSLPRRACACVRCHYARLHAHACSLASAQSLVGMCSVDHSAKCSSIHSPRLIVFWAMRQQRLLDFRRCWHTVTSNWILSQSKSNLHCRSSYITKISRLQLQLASTLKPNQICRNKK